MDNKGFPIPPSRLRRYNFLDFFAYIDKLKPEGYSLLI